MFYILPYVQRIRIDSSSYLVELHQTIQDLIQRTPVHIIKQQRHTQMSPSPSTPRISAKKKPTRVSPSWLKDLWSIRLDRFFIESLVCPRCNSQKTTSNKTREFKGVTTKPLSKRLSNALTHDNYAQKHPYRCAYPSRPQTKPER